MSNATRQIARAQDKSNGQVAPALPAEVDAAEFWRLQAQGNALEQRRQELRAVQAELRELDRKHGEDVRAFHVRYALGRGDTIDADTMKISREQQLPVTVLDQRVEDAVLDQRVEDAMAGIGAPSVDDRT